MIVRVVAVIGDVLSPSEATKERSALGLRDSECANRLVGVIGRAIASEHVSSFVTHITCLERGVAPELVLNCQVPGIKCWQSHLEWTRSPAYTHR